MTEGPPTWTIDQVALLGDTRLSGDARVVGLIVSQAGPEGVTYGDLEDLLPDLSRDALRRATQKLERFRYVVRKVGGRANPDRFVWADSLPATGNLNGQADPLRLGLAANLMDSLPATGNLSALSLPATGNLSPPTSSSTSSTTTASCARAREFADRTESLVGCRGALLDYLATGRPGDEDRSLAYAQSVAGIIEGTDEQLWMMPDGAHLNEGRAKVVAGCLNDLRQGDETGKYFPGPPGDIRNLHSKIRYKVKSIWGTKNDARKRSSGAAAAPGKQPAGARRETPDVNIVG